MEDENLYIRKISAKPGSFNEKTQSVWVIAATENPLLRFDLSQQKMVHLVHLVDGAILPRSGQVPLLDTHNRGTVVSIIGSARNFRVSGRNLECEVFFSGTEAGKNAAQKVKEGHLTDFSVGYIILETFWIPEGQTKEIRGRTFKGPLRVNSLWRLIELSIAAIGADENAKVIYEKQRTMPAEPQMAEICSDTERGIPEIAQAILKTVMEKKETGIKTVTEKRKFSFVDIAFFSFIAMMLLGWIFGIF
ncbi:MAG: HK97 family phage prohead protease [Desulfococcaceae bacterium]